MISSFIAVALAFSIGFFVVPPATKRLLIFKYEEINTHWNQSLREYMNHMAFVRRKPQLDGEKVERSIAQWSNRQIVLVNGQKLSFDKVCALRDAGIISKPSSTQDSAAALPREHEVEATYRLVCTLPMRVCCGLLLALAAAVLSLSNVGAVATIAGIIAGAAMESTYLCDMQARIIPYQLCLLFGTSGIAFAFAVSGLQGLAVSVGCALGMYAILYFTNVMMLHLSGSPAIGNGDLRFIPMICIFSGLLGSFYGFLGASLVMGGIAAVTIFAKGGNRKSYVPYAPGLSCWYAIGLIAQVATCA